MRILVSYNKKGAEAEAWSREIEAASDRSVQFLAFNHGEWCDPLLYSSAVELDRRYQNRDPNLLKLYAQLEEVIGAARPDVLFVTNAPPYHPDYLRRHQLYKVLNTTDDPGATYERNIPYLHAYDHVMYCDPLYSADFDMKAKMVYCGMVNANFLPLGVFDFEFNPAASEADVFGAERPVDVVYVGSFFRQKLDLLSAVQRKLGSRVRIHGLFRAKHNLYYNARFGAPGWIRPISHAQRVTLYQSAKIGFNIHWNEYGLGNQRLYHLPANGVMQLSDCADGLHWIFTPGEEVVGYRGANDLLDKIDYYLRHDEERTHIARAGYRRTMHEYRIGTVLHEAANVIQSGMERTGWSRVRGVVLPHGVERAGVAAGVSKDG